VTATEIEIVRSKMYMKAFEILEDIDDAEDAVQDAWIQIQTGAGTRMSERAMVNLAAGKARMLGTKQEDSGVVSFEELSPEDDKVDAVQQTSTEHLDLLARIESSLPKKHADILFAYFSGTTAADLAGEHGVSEDKIRSWVKSARTTVNYRFPGGMS